MKTTLKAKMAILVLGCIILSSGCMSTLEMLDEIFLETEQVASSKTGYAIGTYDTTYGMMELFQSGSMISGTYTGHTGTGTVEGLLEGNTVRGTWKDESAAGRITFVFTPGMQTFSGYWSYGGVEPRQGLGSGEGGAWEGTRTGTPAKQSQAIAQPVQSSQTPRLLGSYDTTYGKMELSQSGNRISGTYTGHTGSGTVEGVLDGNTLRGTWKDEDAKGRIAFVFVPDMSTFSGYWSYDDLEPKAGSGDTWVGNRTGGASKMAASSMPAAQPAATEQDSRVLGSYDTTYGKMELSQSGNRISGTYTGHTGSGTVEGVLDGSTLRGTWKDESGNGRIAFVFAPDMNTFSGYWSYDDIEPKAGSGDTWVGNRTGEAPPSVQKKSTAAPAKGPLFDISGTYSTDFGMMELMQDGTSVQGSYITSTGTGTLEGTLDGLTIWGTWHEGEAYGRIRFVFPPDRSKFTGYWSYRDIDPRQDLSSTDGGSWDGFRK